jgi:hypothetical protein
MDAGIADTLNRHAARLIAEHLDGVDTRLPLVRLPWYMRRAVDVFFSPHASDNGYRAWLIGRDAARTPGIDFDGTPADCDWENLFSHFRAEILARRDPQTPPAGMAETLPGSVV